MKKTHIGRGLVILLLISICVVGFVSSTPRKAEIAESAKSQLIDPEDMVEGGYYVLWDHGSGLMVVQYDKTENDVIYSKYSMTPSQSLFTPNASCTVYDAGEIQLAGLLQILHLLRCILAGVFVP